MYDGAKTTSTPMGLTATTTMLGGTLDLLEKSIAGLEDHLSPLTTPQPPALEKDSLGVPRQAVSLHQSTLESLNAHAEMILRRVDALRNSITV